MKKPEKHFVNHSEVLKIIGSYRYQLLKKIKEKPDDDILKYLQKLLEDISEDFTLALFQKGKFAEKPIKKGVSHED